jgi:predicted transcriptional regulator
MGKNLSFLMAFYQNIVNKITHNLIKPDKNKSSTPCNKNRLRIYNFIYENPGVYFREVAAQLKINKGTTEYHLKILETTGLITNLQIKGYKRYFINKSTFSNLDKVVLSLQREDTPRKILIILREKSGLSSREVACIIGVSRPTIVWYMKALTKYGIIESENGIRIVKYRISSEFLSVVQEIR